VGCYVKSIHEAIATIGSFTVSVGMGLIRIATASPSLSYLPIYTAVKKGFFAMRRSAQGDR
jgi:hypothetical protein